MRRILVPLLLLGLLIAPAAIFAADSPNYVTLKLGMYQPGSKTLGSDDPPSDMKFKSGFNGELAVGHKFMPNLAAELGVGRFSTKDGDFTTYEGGGIVEKGSVKVDVIPITLNLKGIYPIDKLDLYVLGGVGLYYTKAKFEGIFDRLSVSESKTKSVFGFQLGAGADYNFLPNVFAGLEFKYLWAKPKFTFDDGSESKFKIDGMQITANIGYRF
jgi:outer membrane protein W